MKTKSLQTATRNCLCFLTGNKLYVSRLNIPLVKIHSLKLKHKQFYILFTQGSIQKQRNFLVNLYLLQHYKFEINKQGC